jgi:hypothetical protein
MPVTVSAEIMIQENIAASAAVKHAMLANTELLANIAEAAELVCDALLAGRRVFLAEFSWPVMAEAPRTRNISRRNLLAATKWSAARFPSPRSP